MSHYKFLQRIVTLFLLFYVIFGSGTWLRAGVEYFPFYSWDLFSFVPNTVTDFGLLILSVDGQPLYPPRYFETADDLFREAQSINAVRSVQNMGSAILRQEATEIGANQTQIEALYFTDYSRIEYALVQRSYFPLNRFRTGAFQQEIEVGRFEYNRTSAEGGQ